MAVAGKVAITPRGEWDSKVLYDKLSLVTHENAIYIAKKQSQGVVPVDGEYWMFCMQNAGAEDIQNIVNGTTVVGKANSLANSRMIGRASFDGTANISLANIMGQLTTTTSTTENINKWTKIARVNISDTIYSQVTGMFYVKDIASDMGGLLKFFLRVGSTISTETLSLEWMYVSDIDILEKSIAIVKVQDGIFDVYFTPIAVNISLNFVLLDYFGGNRITLYSKQEYVDSIEAVATSSLSGYVERAIQDSSGNNIVDTYFPKNKVVNNKVTTKSGYAVDARQLNESVEGSYAKGIAENITKINADLANLILNGNTLSIPNIAIPVCITGGGKDFIFSIPIGKYAPYTKASIHGSVAVRQNGNYLIGSSAQNAEMTFTGNVYNGNLIHVHYTFSTSIDSVINNDVAIMVITGLDITFS